MRGPGRCEDNAFFYPKRLRPCIGASFGIAARPIALFLFQVYGTPLLFSLIQFSGRAFSGLPEIDLFHLFCSFFNALDFHKRHVRLNLVPLTLRFVKFDFFERESVFIVVLNPFPPPVIRGSRAGDSASSPSRAWRTL